MSAKELAQGGMLAGLSVALMYFGGMAEYISVEAGLIAGAAVAIPLAGSGNSDCGPMRNSLLIYAATVLLSAMVSPDKILVVEYLIVFGLYPMLKYVIEGRVRVRAIRLAVKMLYCELVIAAVYVMSRLVVDVEIHAFWWNAGVFILANATFIAYDLWLSMFVMIVRRLLKRL